MRLPRVFASRIAGLGLRFRVLPTPPDTGVGVLAELLPYSPILDEIGELPAVSCWRLRGEDDFHFKHRLALHLQEQLNLRDNFEHLLQQVLATEPR